MNIKQTNKPVFLMAAYGRSYATAEAALCAWKDGKDFLIMGGPYCSIRDDNNLRKQFTNIYLLSQEGWTPAPVA